MILTPGGIGRIGHRPTHEKRQGHGDTLTVQSNRPDTDYFIWSAGLSAQFIYGLSGFVNYQSYAGYGDVELGEWSVGARWEKTF